MSLLFWGLVLWLACGAHLVKGLFWIWERLWRVEWGMLTEGER